MKCKHSPCPQEAHSPAGNRTDRHLAQAEQCDKYWVGAKCIKVYITIDTNYIETHSSKHIFKLGYRGPKKVWDVEQSSPNLGDYSPQPHSATISWISQHPQMCDRCFKLLSFGIACFVGKALWCNRGGECVCLQKTSSKLVVKPGAEMANKPKDVPCPMSLGNCQFNKNEIPLHTY